MSPWVALPIIVSPIIPTPPPVWPVGRPKELRARQLIRIRLVNAGFLTHKVHVHGAPVRIVATDGHDLPSGAPTTAPIPLSAAGRIDVELVVPAGAWSIELHDGTSAAPGATVMLRADGATTADPRDATWHAADPTVDLASYSASTPRPSAGSGSAESFVLHLNDNPASGAGSPMAGMSGMDMGNHEYTINGKKFPQTDSLPVTKGDAVTVTFINDGQFDHPMHIHGHAFRPVSINRKPWVSTMLLDTVLVPAGAVVTVQFVANNPGVWMIHCHELHHAAAGMETLLTYAGSPRLARLSAGVAPE